MTHRLDRHVITVRRSVIAAQAPALCVATATRAAAKAGLSARVRFVQGDAEALPLPDEAADGALCECALCTFPDKATAVRELARLLRPTARVAIRGRDRAPE